MPGRFPVPLLLHLHPAGAVRVNEDLCFVSTGGETVWFVSLLPIGRHADDDKRALRRRLGELAAVGAATPAQLARACGLSKRTVERARKLWQQEGEAGFYKPRRPRPFTAVSAEIKQIAEAALAAGESLQGTARKAGLYAETLRRNVLAGIVRRPAPEPQALPDAAVRDRRDTGLPMGRATRDVAGRVAASLGQLQGRLPRFEALSAVACGGVLTALPALLGAGLLRHAAQLPERAKGFYSRTSVLLLAALLLLARVRNFEGLRKQSPGEWGALLGLDRCPEVKTMRALTKQLAADAEALRAFQSGLAAEWLEAGGGALNVDGHSKVYTGTKGRLPKHFVPRLKLKLPAAASYWVHVPGGRPLLWVPVQVDHGLVQALGSEIVPRLEAAGMRRRRADLTAAGAGAPDATLVFDREGWSPELFRGLAREGVACITWRKGEAGADWPESEFERRDVPLRGPGGERRRALLLAARRVSLIAADSEAGEEGFEVREIRLLTERGRQVAIVTTHPSLARQAVAGALLSRWAQENFFKYARAEFGLDSLPEHLLEPVDPDETVRNPAWSELDRDLNRARAKRGQRRDRAAEAGRKARQLRRQSREGKGRAAARLRERAAAWQARAREARQQAAEFDAAATVLAERRRNTPQHIRAGDLPEERRYDALPGGLRELLVTLKMIAYRAETAMMATLGVDEKGRPLPRSALQALFRTPATLAPDGAAGVLRVEILHQASAAADRRLEPLLQRLNATGTVFPGSDLRLEYQLAADGPAAVAEGLAPAAC